MYSLDVNFLNDRAVRPTEAAVGRSKEPRENSRAFYMGLAALLLLPLLAGGLWFYMNQRKASLNAELAALDQELAELGILQTQLQSLQNQVQQIENQNQALATVFDRIKPWSAILQDIRERVPAGVQISLIQETAAESESPSPAPAPSPATSPGEPVQPPPAAPEPPPPVIQITGQARTFDDANDFLLTLQGSPFLNSDQTRLVSAELVDNPTNVEVEQPENRNSQIEVELPRVVNYTIESTLSDRTATQLFQDLERTLAVGLAARIQALKDKGVIQP
jgi:type IV pilus assembly protein PilN